MGLPVGGGSLPLGFQNVGMLSGLPQMWATAGQPYPSSLMSATQLQELCASGTNSSATQLQHPVAAAAASDPQQLAALLRWAVLVHCHSWIVLILELAGWGIARMREYRMILARFLQDESRREISISRDCWKMRKSPFANYNTALSN